MTGCELCGVGRDDECAMDCPSRTGRQGRPTMPKTTELTEQGQLLRAALDEITAPQKVVGLDLSLTAAGMAYVYADRQQWSTTVQTKPNARRYGKGDGGRLLSIAAAALDVVRAGPCPADLIVAAPADLVMIEAPFASLSGGSVIFEVHGAVKVTFEAAGITCPIVFVPPSTLKVFVLGGAKETGKAAMVATVRERYGLPGFDDNQADAVALAHLGWALLGRPHVELPESHMRAVDTIANPGATAAAKRARAAAKRRAAA